MQPMPKIDRIVSLLPSATEIVSCLGMGHLLVARSHECDFPAEVRALPVCTGARLASDVPSGQIDAHVKELLAQALSIYSIDEEVLRRVAPQLIVTQSQCEVCAVSLADVEQAVRRVLGSDVSIVSLAAEKLEGIWADIESVAVAAGVEETAGRVIARLRGRIEDIEQRVARDAPNPPSVLCIEWIDPLMSAGNWMPEIVEKAGGRSLLAHAGSNSPWIEWEAVLAEDPDVIVVLPCGFDLARTRAELAVLTERKEWRTLGAVRDGRVFVTDGNQYFNRPGPRIVDSVEIMAEMLHPRLFDFGHEGVGWERL
jgi:iron complex transport system substrate-binding protein